MEHHFNVDIAIRYGLPEAVFLHNLAFWIINNKANNRNFYDNRYWSYNTQKALSNIFPYFTRQNLRTIISSCIKQDLTIIGNFNVKAYDKTSWYTLTDLGLSLFPLLSTIVPDLNNKDDLVIDLTLDPILSVKDEQNTQKTDPWLKSTNQAQSGFSEIDTPKSRNTPHWLESTNGMVGINQPIPDSKQDNKQKIKDKNIWSSDDDRLNFEQFWYLYPRKIKKKECVNIWVKNKLFDKAIDIQLHVMKRLASEWKTIEKRYIPHPTSFLRGERWLDEIVTNENVIPIKSSMSQHNKNINYVMEKLKNGR